MEERSAGVNDQITIGIVKTPRALHFSSHSPIDDKSAESAKTEPVTPSEEAAPSDVDALLIAF